MYIYIRICRRRDRIPELEEHIICTFLCILFVSENAECNGAAEPAELLLADADRLFVAVREHQQEILFTCHILIPPFRSVLLLHLI